ncbi:MAG: radical SAM protein [Thermodesulfovibrionales bacterium]
MNRLLVEKAQKLLAAETGTVFKDPGGRISIALAYPNHYSVGMSSLGFQGVYGMLNAFPDIVCERVFLPSDDDLATHRRTRSGLFALESKRPLSAFRVLAFSVSFENDFPNILTMLDLAGIPRRRADRDERMPLLIMGGACAFYNPEPLADFFDLCFIGEAEESLAEFLDAYRASSSRRELLDAASGIRGVYLPGAYEVSYDDRLHRIERKALGKAPEKVVKRSLSDLSLSFPGSVITTPYAEFRDMSLVEAMRGCPWSCRFCVAGRIYKPVRRKDLSSIIAEVSASKTKKVGLIGPSLSDHPQAADVLSLENIDFSITSLRAHPRSAELVRLMKRHRSVSIAPEAGTQRLRRVINKQITEEDILTTAGLILESGIETLRLYFMVGLPTETQEDIDGILELSRKIRGLARRGTVTLSVSTFVPKPFTPFQWHPMERLPQVKAKLAALRKGLAAEKGMRVLHDVPKYAHLQGLFSLGDRRVGSVIEEVATSGFGSLKFGTAAVDPEYYVFRTKETDEDLPWDFIDAGVGKEKLAEEYRAAVGP